MNVEVTRKMEMNEISENGIRVHCANKQLKSKNGIDFDK